MRSRFALGWYSAMYPGQHPVCCCSADMVVCYICRPVVLESHVAQYQAPIVTPSPRAGSVTYIDEDHVAERGTLLPKRQTPESSRHGAASTSAAATATATLTVPATEGAGVAALEPPRHRRTGSDCSRGKPHIEGVRAKVVTTSACGAKGNKFGSKSQQEFSTITELLGANIDDEDFCPTCLEPYTDDNPKIFTRCGHAFHMQCIYAWLERKSTCPLCESPMDLQDDVLL
eukprot:GHRR01017633.1.p1 GENE.GHRR01017633.1~~GHRR01017633.1.p1  ORF type:complete len:230 (+),score=47.96 GHRR01017633.1:442-1131(+)